MLDALTWHVMDATADDWESLDQILPHVHQFVGRIATRNVALLISRLVDDGLMEEMRHAPIDGEAIVRDPIEYWFRMTPRGRALWAAEGAQYRVGDDAV